MTEWNAGRLDDLSRRMDDGFAEVKADTRELSGRLDQLSGRFDELQHTLVQVAVAATVGAGAMVLTSIGIILKLL